LHHDLPLAVSRRHVARGLKDRREQPLAAALVDLRQIRSDVVAAAVVTVATRAVTDLIVKEDSPSRLGIAFAGRSFEPGRGVVERRGLRRCLEQPRSLG
jgi:hypothetical protein